MDLAAIIRDVPDFPVEGVLFKDITPLLRDPAAYHQAVIQLVDHYRDQRVDQVLAIESRGFIFGAPLAIELHAGFVPVRKPGKLPSQTIAVEYTLEYGSNRLEMHTDAIRPGERVLVVDDLLATGGSAKAAIELAETLGGQVVGAAFVVELLALKGIERLAGYPVYSLVKF
ncbi:MAG: adenine phosphoribosyltransferase [Anaerolineales bacterium]